MNGTNSNGSKQLPDVFNDLKRARSEQMLKKQTEISKSLYKRIKEAIDLRFNKGKLDLFSEHTYSRYKEQRKPFSLAKFSNRCQYYLSGIKKQISKIHIGKIKFNWDIRGAISERVNYKEYIPRAVDLNISIREMVISLTIAFTILFATNISVEKYIQAASVGNKNEPLKTVGGYENNSNKVDIMGIISDNISITTKKEIIIQEQSVMYETIYVENNNLPKDEEVLIQEGVEGIEELTIIRTFENDEIIDENLINVKRTVEYVEEIIEIGTSEFLAEYGVHIGDMMYTIEDTAIREFMDEDAEVINDIGQKYDVKLLEVLDDGWCKVSFQNSKGFIKVDVLTSEHKSPGIAEESRIHKIVSIISYEMKLNAKSKLTKEDFRRILSGEPRDQNSVFKNNADAFYYAEQKYNINGVFLASVGIHESAWGTSRISIDKKNLFGYGAYDRDPYSFSFSFDTYEEGIDLLGKVFAKYYLNPAGVDIFEGELSTGSYYNGATVEGVNTRYASDENWSDKVYTIMEYLYNKL